MPLVYGVFKKTRRKLMKYGIKTKGIICYDDGGPVKALMTIDTNASASRSKVLVQFETENGSIVTGLIKQEFAIFYSGQYQIGQVVQVYYDKNKPGYFFVASDQSEFLGRLTVILTGLIFIVTGIFMIVYP